MPNFRPTVKRIRTRSRGVNPPRWPFTLNLDSPQARDLVSWIPLAGNTASVGDVSVHIETRDMAPQSGGHVIAEAERGSYIVPSDLGVYAYESRPSVTESQLLISANDVNNWPHGANGDRITTFCRMFAPSSASATWGPNQVIPVGLGTKAPQEWNMNLEGSDTSTRRIWFRTNGANNGGGNTNVPHDQWNDICATWKVDTSTGEVVTYLNGVLDKSVGVTDTSSDTNNVAVYYRDQFGAGVQFYDGRVYRRVLTLDEVHELTDPATKWDLFHELGRRSYFWTTSAAAGGRVMSSLVGAGGLAGEGGIAGKGGGLAA